MQPLVEADARAEQVRASVTHACAQVGAASTAERAAGTATLLALAHGDTVLADVCHVLGT